ncbi:hypothetical protein [Streptomyces sp. cg36]|uniref:hypothetical protein n=1 Tax=Streptomyces sp. cg36 TaxID=3238798 RepID=UPI0034E2B552
MSLARRGRNSVFKVAFDRWTASSGRMDLPAHVKETPVVLNELTPSIDRTRPESAPA